MRDVQATQKAVLDILAPSSRAWQAKPELGLQYIILDGDLTFLPDLNWHAAFANAGFRTRPTIGCSLQVRQFSRPYLQNLCAAYTDFPKGDNVGVLEAGQTIGPVLEIRSRRIGRSLCTAVRICSSHFNGDVWVHVCRDEVPLVILPALQATENSHGVLDRDFGCNSAIVP